MIVTVVPYEPLAGEKLETIVGATVKVRRLVVMPLIV